MITATSLVRHGYVDVLRVELGPVYGQYLVTEYRVGYRFDLSGADGGDA